MNTKEAIERIKARFDKWALDEEDMKAIQTLIPELAESEDERIRKAIVKILLDIDGGYPFEKYGIFKKSALAYLEKQKELTRENVIKELEKEFYACGTTPKWFHNAMQGAIDYGKADALGKFDDVPSVISDELRRQERETAISQLKLLNDVYIGDEKWKEQKPAEWSEEDRNMLNSILLHFNAPFHDMNDVEKKMFTWLQSLQQRFNLQPKQEWSEEDKRNIETLISEIEENYGEYDIVREEYPINARGLVNWLNSLRPQSKQEDIEDKINNFFDAIIDSGFTRQDAILLKSLWKDAGLPKSKPHWKPSEEQMEALARATNRCVGVDDAKILIKLLEQLKKL